MDRQEITIRNASADDAGLVASVLGEAAEWLASSGMKLWEPDEVSLERLGPDVRSGMYRLAYLGSECAGCFRFQTEDMEFWDDVPHEDSAFIHRVAVRRKFSGQGVSKFMIDRAKDEARSLGKRYLRLDCADRPRLRAVYEREGFVFHSIKVREPFSVARYQFEL